MPNSLVDFLSFVNRSASGNDSACIGVSRHSPTPLTIVAVSLYPDGPEGQMCPTCAANYNKMWDLICTYQGAPPWLLYRKFGSQLRSLGAKAWAEYNTKRSVMVES